MKTLIRGGHVVTLADRRPGKTEGGAERADLLVEGERISAILPGGATLEGPLRIIDATGCVVIPGFVQGHVHLCQTLMRGMADDLPLLEWLKQRIWPLEAAHDEASLYASARLGLFEMTRAGTTTILDMGTVHGEDAVFEAARESGIGVFSGKAMMDMGEGVPAKLRERTDDSIRESDDLAARWNGKDDGRLRYAYAPRFILSCTEKLFRAVTSRVHDGGPEGPLMHSHVAEHPGERDAVRKVLGADDVDVLRSWGFWGEKAILAHGVQLTDKQARMLARDRTRIVHCPSANLKLGSGIARVAALDALGVPLALGADGAPCNNNMDPFVELRHAALLAKVRTGETSLPALRALRLATRDGAEALGLGETHGTLEPGKYADLVVVRVDGAHVEPGHDLVSRLVYACTSADVAHVFARGQHLVRFGEHTHFSEEDIVRSARKEAAKVRARANL
ncbi:MAG: amidohydrolase family protein [Polyangiaceae bacterium]